MEGIQRDVGKLKEDMIRINTLRTDYFPELFMDVDQLKRIVSLQREAFISLQTRYNELQVRLLSLERRMSISVYNDDDSIGSDAESISKESNETKPGEAEVTP